MLVFNQSGNSFISPPSVTLSVSGASPIDNFLLDDGPVGLFFPRAVFSSPSEIPCLVSLLACLLTTLPAKLYQKQNSERLVLIGPSELIHIHPIRLNSDLHVVHEICRGLIPTDDHFSLAR